MTVERNRSVCAGHDLDGTEENCRYAHRLDIEGNEREVRDSIEQAGDPLGRIVMRYEYDMLGNRIHQLSMEAGERWMLDDAAGTPIRVWDDRGHNFSTVYDALRRAIEQSVRGTTADSDPRTLNVDVLVDKIEYGEPPADASQAEVDRAAQLNLRTRIYRHFDSAGVVTNARLDAGGNPLATYDFKGNLLHTTRRLVSDYTAIAPLEAGSDAGRRDLRERDTIRRTGPPHSAGRTAQQLGKGQARYHSASLQRGQPAGPD